MPKKGKPHYNGIDSFTFVRTGEQQLVLLRGLDRQETYPGSVQVTEDRHLHVLRWRNP
ncbi:hypothetical protein [Pseudomonas sp. SK2]|uniref:hypothetical protein n=1 Tax=Pseudomonas sp. SK2 TaxID=2841063 RepID=UPI00192A7E6D|nr:hypothetical protein [Pseudomonas sp. SK2]QQZ36329.1 hypothetical protein IF103_24635 [Pseudomonas sp. SK2]